MREIEQEKLEQRVEQLEELVWAVFRAMETYITVNDLLRDAVGKRHSEGCDLDK